MQITEATPMGQLGFLYSEEAKWTRLNHPTTGGTCYHLNARQGDARICQSTGRDFYLEGGALKYQRHPLRYWLVVQTKRDGKTKIQQARFRTLNEAKRAGARLLREQIV